MRKKILALTMAASVLALAACSDKDDKNEEAIVTSKAGDVTKNELYEEMKDSIGEQAVQLIIIEKVLDNKYDISDKKVDEELAKTKEQLGENFESYLSQQGQTEDSFKKILRLNLLQEEALTDGVEVTEKEMDQRIKLMNTELNAKHVLVADEETALEVKKKLEGGADFAEVAKEFSTEEAAQESGGDLGWFGYGQMVPEFQNAAYELELNKFSDPVQSEHGFHIIQVTEKRDVEAKELKKEEKEAIRKELLIEKANPDSIVEKISKLIKEADVEIKDADLKSALDMFNAEEEVVEDKEVEEDKK